MSWMTSLIETYDRCANNPEVPGSEKLLPIAHTSQAAQIEIVLDGKGNFRRASVLAKADQTTVIPCTEDSAGRTSGPIAHPLCDKLKYVAADFTDTATTIHQEYLDNLAAWTNVSKHPKLVSILKYVQKGQVIADLIGAKVLFADRKGKLLEQWTGAKADTPEIFKAVVGGNQADALVRWRVEHGDLATGTWEDPSLKKAWTEYYASQDSISGLCMITGKQVALAKQHPKKVRHSADNAKLVSSNDSNGYTYRGRFDKPEQALGIGFEETQKVHSALRWLVDRQSFKNGDGQVIVSWSTSGKAVPDPWSDSTIFETPEDSTEEATDVGQAFARRLAKAIAGYKSSLSGNESIVVMVLDSATPGRLAIPYYRELKSSDFLDRLEKFHLQYAWMQNFGKERHFVGAPAPRDIAEAAYGRRLDDKLKKATVERLLPCIIDNIAIPRDLVESISHRVSNRSGLECWEFEKYLGIVCALYRGICYQRIYKMTLEENRKSRDYLFGRLLAIAERIENMALHLGGERRQTTAERLTQRFADRPSSTWRTISLALAPYKSRLASRAGGFLHNMEKLLETVITSFEGDDFTNDQRLSTEYQLGYYCQREVLWAKKEKTNESTDEDSDCDES